MQVEKEITTLNSNEPVRRYDGDVESNSKKEMTTFKRFYSIFTVCISSFLYGIALKMITIEIDHVTSFSSNFSAEALQNLKTLAATIIFLGAGISNLSMGFLVKVNIKRMMISASILQIIGYAMFVVYPHIFVYIIGKFLIGVGTGIAFSYISRLLSTYDNGSNTTFITSLHPVFIVLGLIVSQAFSFTLNIVDFRIIDLSVMFFTAINALLIKFIDTSKAENIKNLTVLDVIKKRENFILLVNCVVFHIGNQLSGVNYISINTEGIFASTNYAKLYSLLALISPIPFMFISTVFLKSLSDGVKVILSCLIIGLSTTFLTFYDLPEIFIFTFLFGFNIGLGYIPWGYASLKFSSSDMNAANNLGVTVNMILGFILSYFSFSMHYYLGNYAYLIYSTVMTIIATYSVFIFRGSFRPIVDYVQKLLQ